MPLASVWLIRAALLHLATAAVLGAMYLAWKAEGWFAFAPSHRQMHVEQMLVGWMVQLVIGVGFWILPRTEPTVAQRSGPLIWIVFGLLNAGVLLAAWGSAPEYPAWVSPAGRTLEMAAALLFAIHAWRRQRPYTRETKRILV